MKIIPCFVITDDNEHMLFSKVFKTKTDAIKYQEQKLAIRYKIGTSVFVMYNNNIVRSIVEDYVLEDAQDLMFNYCVCIKYKIKGINELVSHDYVSDTCEGLLKHLNVEYVDFTE